MNRPDIALRPMTLAEIPLGMRLKKLAHWNQVERDWDFLVRAGEGGNFVASYKGTEAGTVTTLSYQGRFSWIGMVLVDPQFRGLGVGTALLEGAIAQATGKGAIRLDATPQGQKLYETMGFVKERELVRLQRDPYHPLPEPGQKGKRLLPGLLPRIAGLDRPVFGADRAPVLRYLRDNVPPYGFYQENDQVITGYCLGRSGSTFEQIGPIVAHSSGEARDLLLTAMAELPEKPFVVDAPAEKKTWLAILESLGFTAQRPLIRMYRGELLHPGEPRLQYAIAGPELG